MTSMPLPASNENASYTIAPWSSVKGYGTGINNHDVPLSEASCISAECDMSTLSSVANDAASITKAHLLVSALPISTLPVHDEPNMSNNGDESGHILTGVKAVNNPAARCIRREICLARAAAAKYTCATQTHGCAEVRIGWDGEIPRWRRGSELSYVVCVESFPATLSSLVEESMRAAIGMWNDIGVSFKQVARDDPATFAVIYENRNRQAYACSFFPNELSRELIVYPLSLREPDYLANILAHEVGHILGLRHEFAHKREKGCPSILFGSENADSIMNYFDHPEQLQVRKQDLEELERFYAYDEVKYGKLSILDVNPEVWFFSKNIVMNHDTDLLPGPR